MTAEFNRYVVRSAYKGDVGLSRVRLQPPARNNARRFALAEVSDKYERSIRAIVLGHEGPENDIRLDLYQREELHVRPGQAVMFKVQEVGWCKKIGWYLFQSDPAIYVPAWLAFWSVILGGLGFVLGILSLYVALAAS